MKVQACWGLCIICIAVHAFVPPSLPHDVRSCSQERLPELSLTFLQRRSMSQISRFGANPTTHLSASPLLSTLAHQVRQPFPSAVLVNSGLAVLGVGVQQRWLTSTGLIHAWILGVLLWSTLSLSGWALCACYLLFGSLATKVRQKQKEQMGIAEGRGGARGPENVWGSAATGAICAIGSFVLPNYRFQLQTAYVASLATKLSDTFASEFGKAFGRRTFLITTLKSVPRGTEGAVSLEGTIAGVGGSIIIAILGTMFKLMDIATVPTVLVAAFVATNLESLMGACLQNENHAWATNEVINFLNTLMGAVLAVALIALFPAKAIRPQ